jgi:hypothetical protein
MALVLVATFACRSKSDVPIYCIYENVQYSIGATLCAPGVSSPASHVVLECTYNGANEPPRWSQTGRPCDPQPRAAGSNGSGSGS